MGAGENSVAIVGPGRLGQALGKLLAESGIPVRFVAARRRAMARRAVRFIGSGRPVGLDSRQFTEASVILLTASDAALDPLARHLASLRKDWSGKVVLHTCGSLPATVLRPLKSCGAAIGSIHPFQTVPSPEAGIRNLTGCFWAVEGDTAARRVATQWVRALEGIAFRIPPSKRILYHAAAFLVCPTVVTLMDRSARLLRLSGVPEKVARPMLAQFVGETINSYGMLGARRALTGPAVRGDWQTVGRHLRALRRYSPDVVPVYVELLRAMLRLSGRRPGRIIERVLRDEPA